MTEQEIIEREQLKINFNKLYFALKSIAEDYQSPEELEENSEDEYGLDSDEAIQMAYENVIYAAQNAIKGFKPL